MSKTKEYSYIVLMSSEGESLSGQRLFKDHIAEISSDNPYIPTSCPGVFQKQSSALIQKQTPAYSVVRHDWNFKQDLLLRSDETKRAFWQQTPYVFGANRDKKNYPMPTVKYNAGSFMLWAYFSARKSYNGP